MARYYTNGVLSNGIIRVEEELVYQTNMAFLQRQHIKIIERKEKEGLRLYNGIKKNFLLLLLRINVFALRIIYYLRPVF